MPYLDGNNFFSFIVSNFSGTLVGFSFSVRSFDGTTPVFEYAAVGFRVRYVLIPGGVPVAKMPDTFWEDYEAVAEYFGFDP